MISISNTIETKQHKHLIVICGPTAIGKTAVGIQLAKHYQTEIISADSRQFFKEMSIGTAKPSLEEQDGVIHHFIDNLSIEKDYAAGKFEIDALKTIESLFKKHDQVIVVGGSGLYIDALCDGVDDIPSDEKIRNSLRVDFQNFGINHLQEELKEIDPLYFEEVDTYNPQRLMRAIEVYRLTGTPYSSHRTLQKKRKRF